MERSLSDPKLGEVRAVLERLQTFAADPDSTQPPSEATNGAAFKGHATSAHQSGAHEPGAHRSGEPESGESDSSSDRSIGKRRAPAAIGLGIAGTVVIVLGVVWLIVSPGNRGELSAAATPDVTPAGRAISERDAPVKEPLPPARPPRAAIATAQDLLSRGQVQAARKQLLGLASADAADVAWMLARSYDPNFLATLSSADGSPDV